MCPRRRRCVRRGCRRTGGKFGDAMKRVWGKIKTVAGSLARNPTVQNFVKTQVNKGVNAALNKIGGQTSGFYRRRRRRGGRRRRTAGAISIMARRYNRR